MPAVPVARYKRTFSPLMSFRNSDEMNAAIDSVIDVLSSVAVYPRGVLVALEWVLGELCDNVLVHAGDGVTGWMQVVSEPRSNRVEFTVADRGRGILTSLREGYPDLKDNVSALQLAVGKDVTRDRSIGQGNGLTGSLRLAREARGYLNIASGDGELRMTPGMPETATPWSGYRGTIVSMTLPTAIDIDVEDALWGRRPPSKLELAHASEEGIEFVLRDLSAGFRNRAAGAALATRLRNVMIEFPQDRVVVDFAGIPVVSASFADEFLGKLAAIDGLETLLTRVTLRNMSSFVSRTVNVVIAQRLKSAARDTSRASGQT
jgi:anti-sigma regulatory factor (Ser/Thr protein kinase)